MKKLVKILLASTIAATMLLSMVGCSNDKQSSAGGTGDTETNGVLVMATNAEFPPYEYIENQEITGIDVEIAQAIADYMGKELKIENMHFDSVLAAVQSGKADIGVAGITITEDRLVTLDFSDTYITAWQVIIVRSDDASISTPDDLVGKTIGVQLGTTGDIFAEDIEGAVIERYNKGIEAVQALEQSKVDAVIIDNEPAKVFETQSALVKVIDEPFTIEDYAIAVQKDNTELLDQINSALKDLKESGKLDEIIGKYIIAE